MMAMSGANCFRGLFLYILNLFHGIGGEPTRVGTWTRIFRRKCLPAALCDTWGRPPRTPSRKTGFFFSVTMSHTKMKLSLCHREYPASLSIHTKAIPPDGDGGSLTHGWGPVCYRYHS